MHSLRIVSVFLLLILISFGTMIGCDDDKCELTCGLKFSSSSVENEKTLDISIPINCSKNEYACAKECTPIDIDCCIDSFGDEVGSCPEENPFCCEEYDL